MADHYTFIINTVDRDRVQADVKIGLASSRDIAPRPFSMDKFEYKASSREQRLVTHSLL